jgi:hypothetical protein
MQPVVGLILHKTCPATLRRIHSPGELLTNRKQFLMALRCGFRITHVKPFEGIDENLRHNQPSVLLIVGGNDVPGRIGCAGCYPIRVDT